jgi:hypothetical protein
MIKRLLILMLVLGLTSAASAATAALVVETPPDEIIPGAVVTISLNADVDVSGFGLRKITDDASPMGTAAAGSLWSGFNFMLDDGSANVVNSGNVLFAKAGGDAIKGQYFSLMGPGAHCPVPSPLYTFTYTVHPSIPWGTIINISVLPNEGTNSTVAAVGGANIIPTGVSFGVAPEPMTIVLLGLGGLFLRRRR